MVGREGGGVFIPKEKNASKKDHIIFLNGQNMGDFIFIDEPKDYRRGHVIKMNQKHTTDFNVEDW